MSNELAIIDSNENFVTVMSAAEALCAQIGDYYAFDVVSEEVRTSYFAKVRDLLGGCPTREAAEKLATEAEIAAIAERHPDVKIKITASGKKAGRARTAPYLPKAYLSARSVVLKALETGVSMFDADGNPLGKSELSAATKPTSSPQKRAAAALAAFLRAVGQMPPEQQVTQANAAVASIYAATEPARGPRAAA